MIRIAKLISLLIFTISLNSGCSGSYDLWSGSDFSDSDETHFSPPSWIQGTWVGWVRDYTRTFEFTEDDFIVDEVVRYNERLNTLRPEYLNATEQISTNTYQITIHAIFSIKIYHFVYVSDTEVSCTYESGDEDDWVNRDIEDIILTRQ